MGLAFVPLLAFILAAVPAADADAASGIANAVQQGGALGVAVPGAVFFDRLAAGSSRSCRWPSGRRCWAGRGSAGKVSDAAGPRLSSRAARLVDNVVSYPQVDSGG